MNNDQNVKKEEQKVNPKGKTNHQAESRSDSDQTKSEKRGSKEPGKSSSDSNGTKKRKVNTSSKSKGPSRKRNRKGNKTGHQRPTVQLSSVISGGHMAVTASTTIDGLTIDKELYRVPLGGALLPRKMQEFLQQFGEMNKLVGRNDNSIIPRNGEEPVAKCYKHLVNLHKQYLELKKEKDKSKDKAPAKSDETKSQTSEDSDRVGSTNYY
jgi:hypothetical protein